MSWSKGLAREMKAENREVEVLVIPTGEVTGVSHNQKPANPMMPDAATYAKAVVDRVGCGHAEVNGYWIQGIAKAALGLLPEGVVGAIVTKIMRERKDKHEKSQKGL